EETPQEAPPAGYRYRVIEVPLNDDLDELAALSGANRVDDSESAGYDDEELLQLQLLAAQEGLEPPTRQQVIAEQLLLERERELLESELLEQQLVNEQLLKAAIMKEKSRTLTRILEEKARKVRVSQDDRGQDEAGSNRELHEEKMGPYSLTVSVIPLLLLLFLVMPTYIIFVYKPGDGKICHYRACPEDGERFRRIIAYAAVEPCTDFYDHVCTLWLEENSLPQTAHKFSYRDQYQANIEGALRDALKAEKGKVRKANEAGSPINIMVDLFDGCLKSQADSGVQTMLQQLVRTNLPSGESTAQLAAKLMYTTGVDGIFHLSLRRARDQDGVILEFDVPDLLIKPEHLLTKNLTIKAPDNRLLAGAAQEAMGYLNITSAQIDPQAIANFIVDISELSEVSWRYSMYFRNEPPRWLRCLRLVDGLMPKALAWFYHRSHVDNPLFSDAPVRRRCSDALV
ncbi:hypothetical protein HPB47_012199, partial [Ixodes persulcatus]